VRARTVPLTASDRGSACTAPRAPCCIAHACAGTGAYHAGGRAEAHRVERRQPSPRTPARAVAAPARALAGGVAEATGAQAQSGPAACIVRGDAAVGLHMHTPSSSPDLASRTWLDLAAALHAEAWMDGQGERLHADTDDMRLLRARSERSAYGGDRRRSNAIPTPTNLRLFSRLQSVMASPSCAGRAATAPTSTVPCRSARIANLSRPLHSLGRLTRAAHSTE
jgi:hypothetical protein